MIAQAASSAATVSPAIEWRDRVPVLGGRLVTLRELVPDDAPSLLARLTTRDVDRFLSPPPTTAEGFEQFITWTNTGRRRGQHVCFGVVPHGMDTAVGLFQIRRLDAEFETAEWGFALGSEYWGTGMFTDGAQLTVSFAFDVIGARRLEARAAEDNGRGNGALRKLGAVPESVLPQSFDLRGERLDQVLWSISAADWRAGSGVRDGRMVVLH